MWRNSEHNRNLRVLYKVVTAPYETGKKQHYEHVEKILKKQLTDFTSGCLWAGTERVILSSAFQCHLNFNSCLPVWVSLFMLGSVTEGPVES